MSSRSATRPCDGCNSTGRVGASEPVLCVVWSSFFFSSRRRHTRFDCDWSSDVCSSDLRRLEGADGPLYVPLGGKPKPQAKLCLCQLGVKADGLLVGADHPFHVLLAVQDRKSVV